MKIAVAETRLVLQPENECEQEQLNEVQAKVNESRRGGALAWVTHDLGEYPALDGDGVADPESGIRGALVVSWVSGTFHPKNALGVLGQALGNEFGRHFAKQTTFAESVPDGATSRD